MNRKIFTKLWDRLVPIKGLLYLAALQLLFSAIYITFFSLYFQFKKSLIVVHLVLVLGLVLVTTFLMALPLGFARLRQWRLTKHLLSLIPALAFLSLLLIYISELKN